MKDNKDIISDEMLFRYFSGDATEVEKRIIGAWIVESDRNRSRYRRASKLYEKWMMSASMESIEGRPMHTRTSNTSTVGRRFALAFANVLAAVLVCGGAYWVAQNRQNKVLAQTMNTIEVPAGNRMDIVLEDGTKVKLNSGAKLSYPVRFADDRRDVILSGEACFEVSHAAQRPFVVKTFASDIQVYGTEFDVIADECEKVFSVALLNGSVKVRNESQEITMSPGETVSLEGNTLLKNANRKVKDQYRWTEGILNIEGMDFRMLMRNIERAFGVKIVIDRKEMPQLFYSEGELRISDGIDYALNTLRNVADFSYTKDYSTETIIIH